jgi:hypothetical protein
MNATLRERDIRSMLTSLTLDDMPTTYLRSLDKVEKKQVHELSKALGRLKVTVVGPWTALKTLGQFMRLEGLEAHGDRGVSRVCDAVLRYEACGVLGQLLVGTRELEPPDPCCDAYGLFSDDFRAFVDRLDEMTAVWHGLDAWCDWTDEELGPLVRDVEQRLRLAWKQVSREIGYYGFDPELLLAEITVGDRHLGP